MFEEELEELSSLWFNWTELPHKSEPVTPSEGKPPTLKEAFEELEDFESKYCFKWTEKPKSEHKQVTPLKGTPVQIIENIVQGFIHITDADKMDKELMEILKKLTIKEKEPIATGTTKNVYDIENPDALINWFREKHKLSINLDSYRAKKLVKCDIKKEKIKDIDYRNIIHIIDIINKIKKENEQFGKNIAVPLLIMNTPSDKFTIEIKQQDLIDTLMDDDGYKLIESNIADIMKQIYRGLRDLYMIGMIHTDLKPDNILITEDSGKLYLQITDLDDAVELHEVKNKRIDTGTQIYLDPTLYSIKNDRIIGNYHIDNDKKSPFLSYMSSDLYALGIIFYMLVTRGFPDLLETAKKKCFILELFIKDIYQALKLLEEMHETVYAEINKKDRIFIEYSNGQLMKGLIDYGFDRFSIEKLDTLFEYDKPAEGYKE